MQSSILSSDLNTIYENGKVSFTILLLYKLCFKKVLLPIPSSPDAIIATGVSLSKSSILSSKFRKYSLRPTKSRSLSFNLGCFS